MFAPAPGRLVTGGDSTDRPALPIRIGWAGSHPGAGPCRPTRPGAHNARPSQAPDARPCREDRHARSPTVAFATQTRRGEPGKEAAEHPTGEIRRRGELAAEAADRVPAVDEDLVAPHRKEATGIGHAVGVKGSGTSRGGPRHVCRRCRCGVEDVKQLRVGRAIMREKVEAEPTGSLQGQVRGTPTDGVAHVRDGPADVPSKVPAGRAAPPARLSGRRGWWSPARGWPGSPEPVRCLGRTGTARPTVPSWRSGWRPSPSRGSR